MGMCACKVFIATSLDGFIARLDGSIDWLDKANAVVTPGEDCGYVEFMSGVDALVMGRNTFELVMTFPQWPYGDKPLVVMSKTLTRLPAAAPATVSLSTQSPADTVAALAAKGLHRLYIDGGKTIQGYLAAGLIESMIITKIPVLLGTGIPLFGVLPADRWFEHVWSRSYSFGFVQDKYQRKALNS